MENLDQVFNPDSASFWNLVVAVSVLAASGLIARLVRRRVRSVMNDNDLEDSAAALVGRVAGWSVIFLGVVLALSIMGVDMVPVVLLIILVLAFVFFTGKSLVENWAAGLLLQARGPYRIGDRIDTEGLSGFVQETNARSVILRTGDGQVIHVPNVDVLTTPIVNRTGEAGLRRSSLTFGVAQDSDFAAVEQLLIDATASTDGVINEPHPPSAWIASNGDTTVNVELRFWHLYADRHRVRSEVAERGLSTLRTAGVSMPFPTQEVRLSGTVDRHTTPDKTKPRGE